MSALCGGVKVILNATLDPSHAVLQDMLVLTLIFLMNNSETRKFVRPTLDVASILAPLSDTFLLKENKEKKEKESEEKNWRASMKAVHVLLKSWSGLITLASNPLGLRSVVNALRSPITELHV